MVEEQPAPSPGWGEVLLRVAATGICGSDTHGYTGETGRRKPGMVMGHETAGIVAELGAAVSGVQVGTPVAMQPVLSCGACAFCRKGDNNLCAERRIIGVEPALQGSYADFIVVPAANAIPLPAGVTPEVGALAEPLAVGWHAARVAGEVGGRSAAVIGAGPIGLACLTALQRLDAAEVLMVEPNPHRAEHARRLGARLLQATDAPAVDVVLDAVGTSATLAAGLQMARRGGTVVIVGMNAPEIGFKLFDVVTEERTVRGAFCYAASEFYDAVQFLGTKGGVRLATLIEKRVGFDQVAEAFAAYAAGRESALKTLLVPALGSADAADQL